MDNCIFCKIVKSEAPSWKVYENEHTYAFLDINPVNEYHTLIIPKNHYENIFDTPAAEMQEIIATVKHVAMIYQEKLNMRNIQVINNNGQEAQQDVFHIHYHIIPRFRGDGQQIRWKTYPEWRERFDEMLHKIL